MTVDDSSSDAMAVQNGDGEIGSGAKNNCAASAAPAAEKAAPQATAVEGTPKIVNSSSDPPAPPARKRARKNEEDDDNDDDASRTKTPGAEDDENEENDAKKSPPSAALVSLSSSDKKGEGEASEEGGGGGEDDDDDEMDDDEMDDDHDDDDDEEEDLDDDPDGDDGDDDEKIPPKPSPSKLGLFDPESSSAFADRAERMRKSNLLLAKGGGGGGAAMGAAAGKAGGGGARRSSSMRAEADEDEDDYDDLDDEEEEDSYGDEDEDLDDEYGYDEYDEEEDEERMMAAAIAAEAAREEAAAKKAGKAGAKKPAAAKAAAKTPTAAAKAAAKARASAKAKASAIAAAAGSGGSGLSKIGGGGGKSHHYDEDEEDYYSDDYMDEDEMEDYPSDDYEDYYADSPSPRKPGAAGKASVNGTGGNALLGGGLGGGVKGADDGKFGPSDFSDEAVLFRRVRRRMREKNAKADALVSFDINRDIQCPDSWTSGTEAGVAAASAASASKKKSGKRGFGLSDVMDEDDAENERTRAATAAIETVFHEIGVVVLKSGIADDDDEDDNDEALPKKAAATAAGSSSAPVEIVDDSDDDDAIEEKDAKPKAASPKSSTKSKTPAKASASASASAKAARASLGSEVEFVCSKKASKPTTHIIPPYLMEKMVKKAKQIEREVCDRLDEQGELWRPLPKPSSEEGGSDDEGEDDDDGDEKKDEDEGENLKMPSRETAAKERARKKKQNAVPTPAACNFKYAEVASRCPGRLDVRHRMDEPPFNDPRVVRNPVLFPVVQSLLGKENGGAKLVYAGLIFSFPGSSDQPWHMDGAALFPEIRAWLDLPPYALNVFIPLDDVTDEVGPTEFLPASHLARRADSIDDDLLQWAVAESRRQALASAAAAGVDPPPHLLGPGGGAETGFSEEEWMTRHSVFAPLLRRGDALVYDYRSCHRGTRNVSASGRTRTMLYLMYARPWFREHMNFGTDRLFDDDDGDGGEQKAAAGKGVGGGVDEDEEEREFGAMKPAAAALPRAKMDCDGSSDDGSDLGDSKYLV